MYLLPIVMLMIAEAASYVVDVSQNIPRGDPYDNNAQRVEHLRKARMELQKYYDEWLHQKYKARSETVTSVHPHRLIPASHPRWLMNPQEPSPNQVSARSSDVYASLRLRDIPKPYGHGHFHLYHLHHQNGDQAAWTHSEKPQQYSYSYLYGKQPVTPPCAYPPCFETDYVPPSTSHKPVFNYQIQTAHSQYQQDQSAYNHYQTQQNYLNGPSYNQYQDTYQSYNQYQPSQVVNSPNSNQQFQPAYFHQETQPDSYHIDSRYPWVTPQKPSKTPVPARPTSPTVSTSYPPYQYDHHSQMYPSTGPQYEVKPAIVVVRPITNKPIEYSDIEQQQPTLVPLNISTPQTPFQLVKKNSTTLTGEEMVSDLPEELMVATTLESDGSTEEISFSTTDSPSNAESLISETLHAVHEIEAEDAAKPNLIMSITTDHSTQAAPTVRSLPSSSLSDEMETSTTVKPTLLVVTEYEEIPTTVSTLAETQTATDAYSTTEAHSESSAEVSTSTTRYTYGVTTEWTPKLSGTTLTEYTTIQAEEMTDDKTTVEQKYTTSLSETLSTSTEVPVFVKPTLLVTEYEEIPTTVSTLAETQTSTDAYATTEAHTETSAEVSTSTTRYTYGVSSEWTPKFSGPTLTQHTTVQAEETTDDKITVEQKYTTSLSETLSTTTEAPVFITRAKVGSTYKDTIPWPAFVSTSIGSTTEVNTEVEYHTSTESEILPTTTEVREHATTLKPIVMIFPDSETTFTDTPKYTDATMQVVTAPTPWKTEPTTEIPFHLTTEEVTLESDYPYSGTTEPYTTEESTHYHEEGTTALHSPTETLFGLDDDTAPFTILVDDASPVNITEKVSARHSVNDSPVTSVPSLDIPEKTKIDSKGLVRREDSWAKRRLQQRKSVSNVKNTMFDTDSNTISEDLEDLARGHEPTREGLEECFLKHFIHVVSTELRDGKLSKEDEVNLKDVFGNMWPRIQDEAFRRIPVILSTSDRALATRALKYLVKGTPLTRRLGKKSVNMGKVFRVKRQSELKPWQEAILRSILVRERPSATEGQDETYRVVIETIKEQLHAPPPEDDDYADEGEVGDTTELNSRSGEYNMSDNEYYDDDEDVQGGTQA